MLSKEVSVPGYDHEGKLQEPQAGDVPELVEQLLGGFALEASYHLRRDRTIAPNKLHILHALLKSPLLKGGVYGDSKQTYSPYRSVHRPLVVKAARLQDAIGEESLRAKEDACEMGKRVRTGLYDLGAIRCATIDDAPALSPNTATELGFPPNASIFSRIQCRAS